MEIRWVGIDSAGDITGPINEIAVWFAHIRGAIQVEVGDFLSALFLLDGDRVCRHWQSLESSRSYLWRADFQLEDRKATEEEAFQWLFGGSFHIPGTSVFGGIHGRRPRRSTDLDSFVSVVVLVAKDHNVSFPNSDCVINCLLEDDRFGERDRIRASGIDELSVKCSLDHPRS